MRVPMGETKISKKSLPVLPKINQKSPPRPPRINKSGRRDIILFCKRMSLFWASTFRFLLILGGRGGSAFGTAILGKTGRAMQVKYVFPLGTRIFFLKKQNLFCDLQNPVFTSTQVSPFGNGSELASVGGRAPQAARKLPANCPQAARKLSASCPQTARNLLASGLQAVRTQLASSSLASSPQAARKQPASSPQASSSQADFFYTFWGFFF